MKKKVMIGILVSIFIVGIAIFSYVRWNNNRRINEIAYIRMSDQIDIIEYNMSEINIILKDVNYVKNSLSYEGDLKKLVTLVDEILGAFQLLDKFYRGNQKDANTRINEYIENNTDYDSYEEYYDYFAPMYFTASSSESLAKQILDLVAYESNDAYYKANPDALTLEEFWDSLSDRLIEKYKNNPEELFE